MKTLIRFVLAILLVMFALSEQPAQAQYYLMDCAVEYSNCWNYIYNPSGGPDNGWGEAHSFECRQTGMGSVYAWLFECWWDDGNESYQIWQSYCLWDPESPQAC